MSRKVRKHITLPEALYNGIEEPIINYQFNGDFSAFVVFCINLYIKMSKSASCNNTNRRSSATSPITQTQSSDIYHEVPVKQLPVVKKSDNSTVNDSTVQDDGSTINFIDGIMNSFK